MSVRQCVFAAFCFCNRTLFIVAEKNESVFGTSQLDWFSERYPDAASQKLTLPSGDAAKGSTMMTAADLLPTLTTPTILTSFTAKLTKPNHTFPKIPIPLNVPAPPGDPEKPIKPSLDNQFVRDIFYFQARVLINVVVVGWMAPNRSNQRFEKVCYQIWKIKG